MVLSYNPTCGQSDVIVNNEVASSSDDDDDDEAPLAEQTDSYGQQGTLASRGECWRM